MQELGGGAYGLEAFFVPGSPGGSFLAVATRQTKCVYAQQDVGSAYNANSKIYRWNPAARQFDEFQELEGRTAMGNITLPSLVYKTANDSLPGQELDTKANDFRATAKNNFCYSSACSVADDGQTVTVAGLRGITSMQFFEEDNEYYLALAQSVCEHGWTRRNCFGEEGGFYAQPKSAILHWDQVCLLYTSPSPRDKRQSRMPSSA